MDEDTLIQVNERSYVNPQKGLNERNSFIDTLRDVQTRSTAEINQNTYNLGSQVPSNVGGLTGSERLWQAQYQTPQIDAQIANLRTVAQQQALNQATQNLQDIYQNKYKQALQSYYAREKAASSASSSSSGDTFEQGVNNVPLEEGTISNTNIDAVVSGPAGTTSIAGEGYTDYVNEAGETVRHYNDGRIEIIKDGQASSAGTTRESVNDAIKRLESSGKTVTNKYINADDQGNVVLNWRDQNGVEGSEVIKVDLINDLNRGF